MRRKMKFSLNISKITESLVKVTNGVATTTTNYQLRVQLAQVNNSQYSIGMSDARRTKLRNLQSHCKTHKNVIWDILKGIESEGQHIDGAYTHFGTTFSGRLLRADTLVRNVIDNEYNNRWEAGQQTDTDEHQTRPSIVTENNCYDDQQ